MRSSVRKAGAAVASLALLAAALAQDVGGSSAQDFDELDEVVVTGERTPRLWKLSRQGRVLWILGTFHTQPRGFRLASHRLDQVIAESHEVILPGPSYIASRAFASLLTEVIRSDRNPDGATLADLLPAEAYAKWRALRQQYSSGEGLQQPGPAFAWQGENARSVRMTRPYRGGGDIDGMRPTLAWEGLRRAAWDRNGLASYNLEAALIDMAGEHRVPVRKLRPAREFLFVLSEDPLLQKYWSKDFDFSEALDNTDYGDAGCLIANLDLLEPVLAMRRIQAEAWARGDFETYRGADTGVRLRDCVTELVGSVSGARLPGSTDAKQAQERYQRAKRKNIAALKKDWVRAVQNAVRRNKATG